MNKMINKIEIDSGEKLPINYRALANLPNSETQYIIFPAGETEVTYSMPECFLDQDTISGFLFCLSNLNEYPKLEIKNQNYENRTFTLGIKEFVDSVNQDIPLAIVWCINYNDDNQLILNDSQNDSYKVGDVLHTARNMDNEDKWQECNGSLIDVKHNKYFMNIDFANIQDGKFWIGDVEKAIDTYAKGDWSNSGNWTNTPHIRSDNIYMMPGITRAIPYLKLYDEKDKAFLYVERIFDGENQEPSQFVIYRSFDSEFKNIDKTYYPVSLDIEHRVQFGDKILIGDKYDGPELDDPTRTVTVIKTKQSFITSNYIYSPSDPDKILPVGLEFSNFQKINDTYFLIGTNHYNKVAESEDEYEDTGHNGADNYSYDSCFICYTKDLSQPWKCIDTRLPCNYSADAMSGSGHTYGGSDKSDWQITYFNNKFLLVGSHVSYETYRGRLSIYLLDLKQLDFSDINEEFITYRVCPIRSGRWTVGSENYVNPCVKYWSYTESAASATDSFDDTDSDDYSGIWSKIQCVIGNFDGKEELGIALYTPGVYTSDEGGPSGRERIFIGTSVLFLKVNTDFNIIANITPNWCIQQQGTTNDKPYEFLDDYNTFCFKTDSGSHVLTSDNKNGFYLVGRAESSSDHPEGVDLSTFGLKTLFFPKENFDNTNFYQWQTLEIPSFYSSGDYDTLFSTYENNYFYTIFYNTSNLQINIAEEYPFDSNSQNYNLDIKYDDLYIRVQKSTGASSSTQYSTTIFNLLKDGQLIPTSSSATSDDIMTWPLKFIVNISDGIINIFGAKLCYFSRGFVNTITFEGPGKGVLSANLSFGIRLPEMPSYGIVKPYIKIKE